MNNQQLSKCFKFMLLAILIILFTSCGTGSQSAMPPPEGSSGNEVPLYNNAQSLTVSESDTNTFISDVLGPGSLLYSSSTNISSTEDIGSKVQEQFDESLPGANWRVEQDWSGAGPFQASRWRNGDLHLVVFYVDNLDSNQISDFNKRFGISGMQPGSTLIVTHTWDTTQPLPTATPTETSTPTSTFTPQPSATATSTPEPTATPTETPLPTATLPPGSTLFEDNFDDGDANGWLPALASWNVVDQEYICVSDDGRTFSGEENWTDYIVSADIQPLSGTIDSGVLGRVQDEEHFYLAQLYEGRARLYIRNGNWIELTNVPYGTEHGVTYRVALELRGTKINMYVNDTLVTSTEDATYLNGKIGLRCAAGTQAYFDNVTVKLPSN